MNMEFRDASPNEINHAMERSWKAFTTYSRSRPAMRSQLMYQVAAALEKNRKALVEAASLETSLAEVRLHTELNRTIFQLHAYADACASGYSLEVKIEFADHEAEPPRPDLRKMQVPLGPVVVFGASNFPFAYSTAGGDTASALAAGCTVVVKAHPAHARTSELVSACIRQALNELSLDENIFIHLHGKSFETGEALVMHPLTRAVGFTGSLRGGRALYDLACRRPVPIPVFAEMGSVNPVFLLPGKLKHDAKQIASMYAGSITGSAGQFCTKPGILIGIKGECLDRFRNELTLLLESSRPQKMLHTGIAQQFVQLRNEALKQDGVRLLTQSSLPTGDCECQVTFSEADAGTFIKNEILQREVFGSFCILVTCADEKEMAEVADVLTGQLTCSIMATGEDLRSYPILTAKLGDLAGRLVLNGVPTGVSVSLAMHHGGPYPASTDSRFTAVGADAIKRFTRPVCYQNWCNEFLPDELKNENPLGIRRLINGMQE